MDEVKPLKDLFQLFKMGVSLNFLKKAVEDRIIVFKVDEGIYVLSVSEGTPFEKRGGAIQTLSVPCC